MYCSGTRLSCQFVLINEALTQVFLVTKPSYTPVCSECVYMYLCSRWTPFLFVIFYKNWNWNTRAAGEARSSTQIPRTPVAHPFHNANVAQCMHQYFLRVQSSRQLIGGGAARATNCAMDETYWHMCTCALHLAPLHCAKVVRQSNSREATSECLVTILVMIQSDEDCKDPNMSRPNMCKRLACTCARNATGRRRSAKRLSAWRQHATTTASRHANISARRLCGNSLISINSLSSSSSRAAFLLSFPFFFFFHLEVGSNTRENLRN